jgi:hypothetical protein
MWEFRLRHRGAASAKFGGSRSVAMACWFISTTRPVGADVEWTLTPCATEDEAKARASDALIRGLRVEAGTIPGVEPTVRIGWRQAHDWAQSSNARAIRSLHRRLGVFAD